MRHIAIALLGAVVLAATARAQDDTRFALEPGDRIVVVGSTFAERIALSGYFDALAHAAHPDHELVIRHVPWSGDEVGLRPREMNVPTVEDHLTALEPDVVFLCFGMSESFAGADGLAGFRTALDELLPAVGSVESAPRLVLVSPIAHEDLGAPMPTGPAIQRRNADIARYVEVMRTAARDASVRLVDLFEPSADLYAREKLRLTVNGIHPDERGCFHFTAEMGRQLGWLGAPVADGSPREPAERLRRLAYDKHYQFRLLYRPTNTEYVWGRRAEPFGVVNFPPEMAQLARMIAAREQAMWAMDLPAPEDVFAHAPEGAAVWERPPEPGVFPGDAWNPEPVEARGTETSLGDVNILPPGEFAASFTIADGYRIECFASEQDFEELGNPLAMTFDARGRLWVLCAPTYPHLLPGDDPRCMLLILDDTDGDGRADRRTIFADRLNIPTGFAVDTDAVYLGMAPELWKLTDRDGDDVADRYEIVASGFGMPDAHHQISAFEWDPNGGFLMHEGVFTVSNVETPWGTRRTRDAGVWRFDPRAGRLDLISHCSFANPWGHVFDDFGQSVLADASGGDNYAFSHVVTAFEYPKKPRRAEKRLKRGRPTAGCELISGRHFPDDAQGSFLVNQSIGFHGTRWDRVLPDGSSWRAESMPQDLVECKDVNFRPVAMEIGPDGALYIVDWCNPIVGHMQYSVRDPRRDHTHGRIWRVRHAERPLLESPEIATTVPGLLEQLRLPERNTRQHARRRLQTMPATDVFPEVASWLARLEADDPLRDRLVLEALWLHQAHGRVAVDLLDRVAKSETALARAGAVRVLRYWLHQGLVETGQALPRLERAVADADMRVRLEAVVACGFVPSVNGAAVAAVAAEREMDDGLRIALEETLAYLERYGEPDSEIARRLRLRRIAVGELLATEMDDVVARVMLARVDVPLPRRDEALGHLAGAGGAARVGQLVTVLVESHDAHEAIAPLLLAADDEALAASSDALERAATDDDRDVRILAIATLLKSGDDRSMVVGDDPAFATAVLEQLAPGDASSRILAELRRAVEQGRVRPVGAVAEVARHGGYEADTFTWLGHLVSMPSDRHLGDFDARHLMAMAALRAMHDAPEDRWPEGFERFHAPVPAARLEAGRSIYEDEVVGCTRCHGADGRGEEGFPPLDGAPWVLGDPERAASIVMHGLQGPLPLPDGRTFTSVMDPLGASLDDEQIADVLTFVRRSWGNFVSPVSVAHVARAQQRRGRRTGPWEVASLQQQYPLFVDRIFVADAPTAIRSPMVIVVTLVGVCVLILIAWDVRRRAALTRGREET
ncbi:MAG: c-type cytochrome [Planctomycetes bacterium]|nr:c-type cytochrome [Planctomycetota bacterium]